MTENDEEFGDWLTEAGIQPGEWSDGEWDRDTAIEFSFMEANEWAEAEAEKRKLNWCREIIKKSHQERSNKNDQ